MRSLVSILSLCVCFCWNARSQPYTIHTIAGTTRLQDGGSATSAPLRLPIAVAADSNGNVYIADQADNRIRKVDKNGIISTFAGTGEAGYSGDRGPAAEAQLNSSVQHCAWIRRATCYVADSGNAVIRRISTDGTINTIAGNGNPKFGGDNGPAISAQFAPMAVAVDTKGNYYIADGFNYRIRKVDTNGIITTIAGTGLPGYSGDNGPATSAFLGIVTSLAGR